MSIQQILHQNDCGVLLFGLKDGKQCIYCQVCGESWDVVDGYINIKKSEVKYWNGTKFLEIKG